MNVADIVVRYLAHAQAVGLHCPEAREERERVLGAFAQHLGHLDVDEAKAFHLSDWVEANPAWKSISTKRQKANMVRAAFSWAFDGERISRNPFRTVRYAEAERRPDMPDEVFERACQAASKPFGMVLRFLRYTGCRLTELCNAHWDDVNLEKGVWVIPRHKSRRYTGRPKVVALVPEAVELLYKRQADVKAQASLFLGVECPKPGKGALLFCNGSGKAWSRQSLYLNWKRLKRREGLQCVGVSLHGIRHRALSAAIAAGAPLKLISEQAGHQSTAVTERFYFHRSDEHLEAIKAAFGKGIR